MKCIRLGHLGENNGDELAKAMYDYFSPLMVENAPSEELEKLRKQYLFFCRKAFELRVLMRNSLEGYASVTLEDGIELPSNENMAVACAVFRGKDDEMGTTVEFTLFGALVKHAKYRGEGEVLLEKAQVVMASRQSRG